MPMKKKERGRRLWVLLPGLVIALVLLWFFSSLSGLSHGTDKESRAQLETALRRAAVACYAAEGVYPPTLDYLTEHYGIQIGGNYTVYYEVFASNLMPDITVLEKGEA